MADKNIVKTKKPTFVLTDGVTLTYSTYEGIMVHADAQDPVRISEADIRTLVYWLNAVLEIERRQAFTSLTRKDDDEE